MKFIISFFFVYFICVSVLPSLSALCAYNALQLPEEAVRFPELELQVVVNCPMSAGHQIQVL